MTPRLSAKLLLPLLAAAALACAGPKAPAAGAVGAPATAMPVSAAPAPAAPPPAVKAAVPAPLPPLIDRELIFGDPEISAAQLSPDGTFVAFLRPLDGTRNLWVKRVDEPSEKARPITADTKRPIPPFFRWTWDSRYVLFIQDQGGDENYNVYAVEPRAAPAPGAKVPVARGLTAAKNVRAEIYALPKTRPGLFYVGLNDRDPAWHDLYEVQIASGRRRLLRKNDQRFTSYEFDLAGNFRLATRTTEKGDTEILRVGPGKAARIFGCGALEECSAVRFHPDGKRFYALTNAGEGDLIRLALVDAATGKEAPVEEDPQGKVDLQQPIFSEATDQLVGTVYTDERLRFHWRDPAYAADHAALQARFPDRDVLITSATRDDRLWLVSVTADVEPGEVYLFDRKTKDVAKQYTLRERLPREALAPMKAIRYPSSDGLEIPAYLTLPKGPEPRKLPLVVFPHGGPWSRDAWRYHTFAQFLANRGYAVLQPNFRGSTGYGQKFLDAGNREWGDKMQDDLTWGVKHLVDQGVVDPARVGIMGGSYGGYATLAGVTFTPDRYAAAVAIVAPSSLVTLLETIPPYWEAGRVVFYTRMGDPNTPEGKAQLDRQSPLHHIERIRTPLLIVQGANDPRVKKSESDQIVVALRERGFPVEYLVAPDEGHGFQRPVNNMAAFASAERFLAKHLGGRFQEDMPPEVARRLEEITVDVSTVERPARVAAAAAPPATAVPLAPGSWAYDVTLEAGSQRMEMAVTTTVEKIPGGFRVRDVVTTPQGDATDEVTLDPATLALRHRLGAQGPVTFEISVKELKVTGELKMGASAVPIAADLEGELFADGAGAAQVIATLPLAEGYETSFRIFELQTRTVQNIALAVAGAEKVTVPAGTFDTWKVVLTSPEDGTETHVFVDRTSRVVAKTWTKAPSMGGAVITSVLTGR